MKHRKILQNFFVVLFLGNKSLFGVSLIALFCLVNTFVFFMNGISAYEMIVASSSDTHDIGYILFWFQIDFIILVLLVIMIVIRLTIVWQRRNRKIIGFGMHAQFALTFCLMAALPSISMSCFSIMFFNKSLESWFNEKQKFSLGQAVDIANAYLNEHKNKLIYDLEIVAKKIEDIINLAPSHIENVINALCETRYLSDIIIFNVDRVILAKTNFAFSIMLEDIPVDILNEARFSPTIFIANDKVKGLLLMNNNIYVYVSRFIDSSITNYIKNAKDTYSEYINIENKKQRIKLWFAFIFIVIALLIVVLAVGIGLWLATNLVKPIERLISAAEEVKKGNLSIRVPIEFSNQDIGILNRSFNRMTRQLLAQHNELKEANKELMTRGIFIENVLSGVKSGVIAVNETDNVTVFNDVALQFFEQETLYGANIRTILPEFDSLKKGQETEIVRYTKQGKKTLLVKINKTGDAASHYIITFSDATEIIFAQRQFAWSDIARRIAHEIKNPLTPIQLAAGRLKKKYINLIHKDKEIFSECIETIIRQVGYIGNMVSEFSSFARINQPVMVHNNIVKICKDVLNLEKFGDTDIQFEFLTTADTIMFDCDSQLFSQALMNVLINAIDAVKMKKEIQSDFEGRIIISVSRETNCVLITVMDNGIGFDKEKMHLLMEPYVTTKTKGTGLGLSIVQKIIEDHNGKIYLEENPDGGAIVKLMCFT